MFAMTEIMKNVKLVMAVLLGFDHFMVESLFHENATEKGGTVIVRRLILECVALQKE